jgi:Ca-activated chloride channel family protein
LHEQATYSWNPLLPARIKQVALDYGLMSEYTAFVAVDASKRTSGRFGTTVPVAVPVPDGVRYDTTVK